MILFSFKEEPETRKGMPCTAFRWTFQINSWKTGVSAGFVHQHKRDDKWYSSHTSVYEVSLTTSFRLGTCHVYYDGPHCCLDVGFLHFMWGGNPLTGWCKKCMPDDE